MTSFNIVFYTLYHSRNDLSNLISEYDEISQRVFFVNDATTVELINLKVNDLVCRTWAESQIQPTRYFAIDQKSSLRNQRISSKYAIFNTEGKGSKDRGAKYIFLAAPFFSFHVCTTGTPKPVHLSLPFPCSLSLALFLSKKRLSISQPTQRESISLVE